MLFRIVRNFRGTLELQTREALGRSALCCILNPTLDKFQDFRPPMTCWSLSLEENQPLNMVGRQKTIAVSSSELESSLEDPGSIEAEPAEVLGILSEAIRTPYIRDALGTEVARNYAKVVVNPELPLLEVVQRDLGVASVVLAPIVLQADDLGLFRDLASAASLCQPGGDPVYLSESIIDDISARVRAAYGSEYQAASRLWLRKLASLE